MLPVPYKLYVHQAEGHRRTMEKHPFFCKTFHTSFFLNIFFTIYIIYIYIYIFCDEIDISYYSSLKDWDLKIKYNHINEHE